MVVPEIVIIPDVHGRTFWKDAIPHVQNGTPVIFLGDYLDPYSHEGITSGMALENFKEILKETEGYSNVVLLLGNHDMTYVAPEAGICACRTDYEHLNEIHQLFLQNADRFRFVYETRSTLFSHAGLHEKWLSRLDEVANGRSLLYLEQSLVDLLNSGNIEVLYSFLAEVGPSRWGFHPEGSCVWADIQEFAHEKDPLPQRQIVGHTQQLTQKRTEIGGFNWVGDKPVQYGNVVCLDCHQCFYLDSEGNIRFLKNDNLIF